MERHVPDPLKQMRQKQAAEAKLLVAQQRQRAGALREHAKIREGEAVEKAANTERLRTPTFVVTNGNEDNTKQQTINPTT